MTRFAVVLVLAGSVWGQEKDVTAIRTGTNEVLLDLVVRDRTGRFARDLTQEDFEVFEDGAPQRIKSFKFVDGHRLVDRDATLTGGSRVEAPAGGRTIDPLREINLISLVFEASGPESRRNARQAAQEMLRHQLGPNTYVAVVSFGNQINVLQPFTNDQALVRRGIEIATSGMYGEFAAVSKAAERSYAQSQGIPDSVAAVSRGFFNDANWIAELGYTVYQLSLRQLLGLMALVRDQGRLPGRKTVLLLSDGLWVHPDVHDVLTDVIAAANRAHVSIYSVQTTGLQMNSPAGEAKRMLAMAASSSMSRQLAGPAGDRTAVTTSEALSFDIARYSLRANRQLNLSELAEGTGGFLIADTNDFRKPVQQIVEDVRTHYEISYTPASDIYDGRFRTIAVKTRPGLTVRTRNGYYALPMMLGGGLLPFEMAALKALSARPLPEHFRFGADVLRFRAGAETVQHILAIEVPVEGLKVTDDAAAKTAKLRLAYTVLVKGAEGHVTEKISRDVPLVIPLPRAEAARLGNLRYTERLDLRPGRYTVEIVVLDREGIRASAKRMAIYVKPRSELGLSSIVVVGGFTPLKETRDLGNPLQSESGKVAPGVLGQAAGADLNLYAVVYPAMRLPGMMGIGVYRDGVAVAWTENELPAPDDAGAIPVFATIPGARLTPGTYELRVAVAQGALKIEESAAVTLSAQRGLGEPRPREHDVP